MTRVLAYHKEKGLITTHRDELGRETVYDRLRRRFPGERVEWHAIGRLDADTTGLLLFTDDGALVSYATRPDSAAGVKVEKVYRVLAKGLLNEEQLAALRGGVELSGGLGRSGPAKVEVVGFQVATTWIEVTIGEGKNRQVRRMLLAVGSQVIRLCRVRIGGLRLEDLVPDEGEWRELTPAEIESGLGYRVRDIGRVSAPGHTPRAGSSRRPDRSRGARRPR
jgi:23S rRNA pseudouridine2605 synthase